MLCICMKHKYSFLSTCVYIYGRYWAGIRYTPKITRPCLYIIYISANAQTECSEPVLANRHLHWHRTRYTCSMGHNRSAPVLSCSSIVCLCALLNIMYHSHVCMFYTLAMRIKCTIGFCTACWTSLLSLYIALCPHFVIPMPCMELLINRTIWKWSFSTTRDRGSYISSERHKPLEF